MAQGFLGWRRVPSVRPYRYQMEIQKFDHTSINWQVATEFSRIRRDAFRDDLLTRAYWPVDLQFNEAHMPPLADYEQLLERIDLAGKLVRSVTRQIYLNTRQNPRIQIYMLKAGDKYVAGAEWILPDYVAVASIPWYRRVWYCFVAGYNKLADLLSFGSRGNPFFTSGLYSELCHEIEVLGGLKTTERCQELAEMPRKQLENVSYPKDLTYYLSSLCVRTDEFKKGYGKKVLLESAKDVTRRPTQPPPGINGPAKISLFSAPTAIAFYQRLGFSIGSQYSTVLPDGVEVQPTYFFKNLVS